VHTSQHIDVHERTADAIKSYLRGFSAKVAKRDKSLFRSLEELWERECAEVPAADFGLEPVSWDDVVASLPSVAEDAYVITDNSRSEERLSFDDENPRVIIAVGGNTLSRGLTLEGLSVSFFVRTASAYDTLLQMGRWFGYRSGYADLTRIWMTDEMREWFHHLATVEQEIRYEIERYETGHVKPDELGVRLRTHPKLAITAAAKMQNARRADTSYSGRRLQTILFNHRDGDWLTKNTRAAEALITSAADATRETPRPGVTVIGPVSSSEIVEFLSSYQFHDNSRDLDGALIGKYINGRRAENELTHFKIAIMARSKPSDYLGEVNLGLGDPTGCINRARLNVVGGPGYADIKALMSKTDRVVDLDVGSDEIEAMSVGDLSKLRNLPSQGGQGNGTGLLLLYPVSKDSVPKKSARTRSPLEAVEHMIGVGIVFPETKSQTAKVDYVTADVAAMKVEVEKPDDSDDLDEPEIEVKPT
jgi:hypothetical protein